MRRIQYYSEKDFRLSLLIAIFSLAFAMFGAFKAIGKLERWRIYDVAERCLAWETQTINPGSVGAQVIVVAIHQGGDALAYEDLVNVFDTTRGDSDFNQQVELHLRKIFDNIENTGNETYFPVAAVRSPGGAGVELKDSFTPSSVIDQIKHDIFWQTRVEAARLLRGESARNVMKRDPKKVNLEKMLEDLASVMRGDHSLVARLDALKTYKFWACDGVDPGSDLECKTFVDHQVYHFARAIRHWEWHRKAILEKASRDIRR